MLHTVATRAKYPYIFYRMRIIWVVKRFDRRFVMRLQ